MYKRQVLGGVRVPGHLVADCVDQFLVFFNELFKRRVRHHRLTAFHACYDRAAGLSSKNKKIFMDKFSVQAALFTF